MAFKKDVSRDKATFSLDEKVIDNMEDAWMKLRRMLRRKNITKSIIVEEAIKMILDDLTKNEETSKIYKILSKS